MKYCVVIRTLGTGGDKYKSLLESIHNQTVKPVVVYVFIANGYSLPPDQLGYETFVYTRKGMWHQRVYGMQYVAEKHPDCYQLVCDDDISFASNFVEILFHNMISSSADVMTLGVGKIGNRIRNFKLGLLGVRYESNKDDYRIKIAKTAGFVVSTNRNKIIMPTQSGAFACFMIKSSIINNLYLEDEYWVEDALYALPDDQVFFYKCFKMNLNLKHCLEPCFNHLDHGSLNPSRLKDSAYAQSRNFLIFWHRFLYLPEKKIFAKLALIICIIYRFFVNSVLKLFVSISKKDTSIIFSYLKGLKDGIFFINSSKYKSLKKI